MLVPALLDPAVERSEGLSKFAAQEIHKFCDPGVESLEVSGLLDQAARVGGATGYKKPPGFLDRKVMIL